MSDEQLSPGQITMATILSILVIVGLAMTGGFAAKELLGLPVLLGQAIGLGIGYLCSRTLLRRILS